MQFTYLTIVVTALTLHTLAMPVDQAAKGIVVSNLGQYHQDDVSIKNYGGANTWFSHALRIDLSPRLGRVSQRIQEVLRKDNGR
jgi:hypothetical protein